MSATRPEVLVHDGGISVNHGGPGDRARAFPTMQAAARYAAVAVWNAPETAVAVDAVQTDRPDAFDQEAFAALVREEALALRAGNGWRVAGAAGDYTAWVRTDIDPTTREPKPVFNLTKGEVPSGEGGYGRLESILQAKNVTPRIFQAADGPSRDVRAVRAPDFEGKPAWTGLHRNGDAWVAAGTINGPIAYASPAAARAGAEVVLAEAAEPEAQAPRP
jgi:hypothetical protein